MSVSHLAKCDCPHKAQKRRRRRLRPHNHHRQPILAAPLAQLRINPVPLTQLLPFVITCQHCTPKKEKKRTSQPTRSCPSRTFRGPARPAKDEVRRGKGALPRRVEVCFRVRRRRSPARRVRKEEWVAAVVYLAGEGEVDGAGLAGGHGGDEGALIRVDIALAL